MFLVDTNVISELRKAEVGKANANVCAWASQVAHHDMFLSVITMMELEIGVLRIERRDAEQGFILRNWLDGQIAQRFANRILAVDSEAAKVGARLQVPDPRAYHGALIGATALVHNMTVVTRNTADFAPMGVALLNPWEAQPGT